MVPVRGPTRQPWAGAPTESAATVTLRELGGHLHEPKVVRVARQVLFLRGRTQSMIPTETEYVVWAEGHSS